MNTVWPADPLRDQTRHLAAPLAAERATIDG
jgi:hypothetical protein